MTKATNNVARVAAAVAGFGLVAMSFAPMAGAQTTTTTTTSTTTASVTFTRDLTIGSTGADVTALQTWLIAKGFSIPAGATGYFGAQTKAALAAFQAANAITPAAGYFGPITRAKVAAMGGSTTTTGGSSVPGCAAGAAYSSTTGAPCTTSTGSTGLSGGEATLKNYDLQSGDDLSEGDSNKEIAVAQFDVSGGDVNVQRVTVEMQPSNSSYNEHPWQYIDSLSVYSGSKKIGSIDTSSKDAWDTQSDDTDHSGSLTVYSIDIPTNGVIKEGDNQELSIRADAASSIDTTDLNQSFYVQIPDNGVRAVDAAGLQEYTGNTGTGDEVTVGFNSQQTGDLVVSASSDNPSSQVLVADDTNTSDSYDVLAFQIRNKDDVGVDFNTLTFTASNTASTTAINNIVRRATLTLDGDTYTGSIGTTGSTTITFDNLNTSVNSNDTIDGTLSVELYGQSNHFSATGEAVKFNLVGNSTYVDAESSDTGDSSDVTGTASGNTMSIGVNTGISVAGNSNSASESYNSTTPASSTGTFTLKFDVTANGNDVYIPKTVATTSGATSNTGVVIDSSVGASTSGLSVPASLSSTADQDGTSSYYIVHDGDTETFTAQVTFDPAAADYYKVGLDKVRYNDSASLTGLQTLDVDQTKSDYQTQSLFIH